MRAFLIAFIVFGALVQVAPAIAGPDPALVGTWTYKEPDGDTIKVVLNADGTGTSAGERITWSATADTLETVEDGEKLTFRIARSPDGASLGVSGGDLDKPVVFRRQGATPAPAPAPAPAQNPFHPAPAVPLARGAGTWEAPRGDGSMVVLQLDPDGRGSFDGKPIRWKLDAMNGALSLDFGGAAPMTYHVDVTDQDRAMTVSGADLPRAVRFTLKGTAPAPVPAPGPAPAPRTPVIPAPAPQAQASRSPLVGTWNSEEGQITLNADGTGNHGPKRFKYVADATVITVTDPDGTVTRFPYQIDPGGNRVVLIVNGEAGVLTRAGAPGEVAKPQAAGGVAGVYVAQESSVDPTNAMVLTQYVTLYPDGSVGWTKSEMGATREQVSAQLERFNSFRTGAGNAGQTYGTWQSDGTNVVVHWNIWNNLRCNGRIDRTTGTLLLEKMGTLNEGATLEFKRQ